MLLRFLIILIFFLIVLAHRTQAQFSNQRIKWIKKSEQPIPVDSLSVFPGSIRILSPGNSTLHVTYDPVKNTIQLTDSTSSDSVMIAYRVMPFNLSQIRYHRNPSTYDVNAFYKQERIPDKSGSETREEFFATKGLNKTGSITRGISFGNTQNVFVSSALNLQLEGQLTDDISITAVISDQNVPFQPEGNTQQLQEFDKVFVQLAHKDSRLTVGDLVMQHPLWQNDNKSPSHFLRYYKNVQGGQVETLYSTGANTKAHTSAGAAISKGKFASVLVEVSEGVQGPYRLRGPNNEKFIIVLANSERVYLDGQLLKRGFNYDYVIDYNMAEIVFNPNVVITKFSRVRIDFEYSDRVYSRTILNGFHQQQIGKLHVFANYYNEKDNPRNPLTLNLSDTDKLLLSTIGDSLDQAVVSGVGLLESFNSNLVMYEKVDTLIDNALYTFYRQSANPATALYQLQFTEVGPGKGNYMPKNSTANGKVYAWQAPINGIPSGAYEPIRQIPTPAKKQMLTLGTEYRLSGQESLFAEMAFSEKDVNLFSSLDRADDKGNAFKAGYLNRGKKISFLPKYEWLGGIDYEFDNKNFSPIDRFRDIEFDRNWSARIDTATRADDHIFNVTLGIRKSSLLTQNSSGSRINANDRLIYRFSWRDRAETINGWQQYVDAGKSIGNLQLSTDVFLLKTTRLTDVSEWQRLQAEISYLSRFVLIPGYIYRLDKNKVSSVARKDSVIGTAMNFEEHKWYVRTHDSIQTRFNVDYSIRQDNFPIAGQLVKNDVTHMTTMGLQTKIRRHNDVNVLFTYRNMQHVRQPENTQKEETIMGRLDWNGNWLDENIRSEFTFTAGAGRELKRSYIFLPVPIGEGTHTWRDDNGDGLQELNEFYEAINPDEKNFAKFFVPTDEYQPAYTNTLNYRLNITTPRRWQDEGLVKSFLSKFSSVSSWLINKKITDNNLLNRFVPFSRNIPEEQLLSTQDALRSTLFFNRANPRYGSDLGVILTQHKQLLTNGFEARKGEEYRFNTRINLYKNISLKALAGRSIRTNASDFLLDRNYQVVSHQAGPEIAYQPQASFRLTGAYLYTVKENVMAESAPGNALFNQISLDARWAKVSKRTLAATVKYIQIDYNGAVNSALGYEMLEALRPGNNWTWSFNLQQRLANGLQVNINYEGRKSEFQHIIHIGRMQVSALF